MYTRNSASSPVGKPEVHKGVQTDREADKKERPHGWGLLLR
ncbi:hypothetical protein [Paenibacillus yonginensis]|nr:hypothetical protein [Paenibacillus yonginensis]